MVKSFKNYLGLQTPGQGRQSIIGPRSWDILGIHLLKGHARIDQNNFKND